MGSLGFEWRSIRLSRGEERSGEVEMQPNLCCELWREP